MSIKRSFYATASVFACFTFLLLLLSMATSSFGATPVPQQGAAPSGPKIWLQNNQPLAVSHTGAAASSPAFLGGAAQPVSLASGDLDGDGIADLVVGEEAHVFEGETL